MVWTIEARVHEIVELGGHLYLDIYDDSGNRVIQFNGLAVERPTGNIKTFGGPNDQLMAFTNITLTGTGTSQSTNPDFGKVIDSGTQAEIEQAISDL